MWSIGLSDHHAWYQYHASLRTWRSYVTRPLSLMPRRSPSWRPAEARSKPTQTNVPHRYGLSLSSSQLVSWYWAWNCSGCQPLAGTTWLGGSSWWSTLAPAPYSLTANG